MSNNKVSQYIFYLLSLSLLLSCASGRKQMADVYLRQHNWEKAKEILKAESSTDADTYLQLAEINGHLRLIPEMNRALAHVRALSPKYNEHADFIEKSFWIKYFGAGEENLINKLYEAAVADFSLVAQIDSSNTHGLQRYADALFLSGSYGEASTVYAAVLKISPGNLTAKNNLSEIYFVQSKFDDAITLCNEILDVNENDIETVMRRAYAHDALGNFKKAEDDYHMAALVRPSGQLFSDFGLLYLRNEFYGKAVARLEEALRFTGSSPLLYRYLGQANWRLRDYRQMSKWYRKIVENSPEDVAAWKNLAVALEALGYEADLAAARYHITKLSGTN